MFNLERNSSRTREPKYTLNLKTIRRSQPNVSSQCLQLKRNTMCCRFKVGNVAGKKTANENFLVTDSRIERKVQQTEVSESKYLYVTILIIVTSNCAFKMLKACQLAYFVNVSVNDLVGYFAKRKIL